MPFAASDGFCHNPSQRKDPTIAATSEQHNVLAREYGAENENIAAKDQSRNSFPFLRSGRILPPLFGCSVAGGRMPPLRKLFRDCSQGALRR